MAYSGEVCRYSGASCPGSSHLGRMDVAVGDGVPHQRRCVHFEHRAGGEEVRAAASSSARSRSVASVRSDASWASRLTRRAVAEAPGPRVR